MTQDEVRGRLRDVLENIAELANRGELVTTARIAGELGLLKQNVRTYLLTLRDRGLVDYPARARFTTPIRLTEEGWRQPGVSRSESRDLIFPILGEVAAGRPGIADEQVEAYATRLQDVLALHDGDFLLRVRGESMVGAGIYPGDLVAIHPTRDEPLAGEIVLVALPGEESALLKRWQRHNGTVSLHSENPAFEVMTFPVEAVQVQGCLVGHIGTGRARRAPPTGRAP